MRTALVDRTDLPLGFKPQDVPGSSLQLLVPAPLPTRTQLRLDSLQHRREVREARVQEQEARASRPKRAKKVTGLEPDYFKPAASTGPMGPPNPYAIKTNALGEMDIPAERWPRLEDLGFDPRRRLPVFDHPDAIGALNRALAASSTKATKDRAVRIYRELKARGVLRQIAMPAPGAFRLLVRSHPQFEEIVSFIEGCVAVGLKAREPMRIPPMLILGGPGIGKSHFARAFAIAMGAPLQWQSMDGGVAAAAFVGSDKHWVDSAPGCLFNQICMGGTANPVIVLDELDKVGRPYHQDPLAALHTLLEPSTARRVRDLAVDLEFDASLVTWIATANGTNCIPSTLLSRFKVFLVPAPTASQALAIAESVIDETFAALGLPNFQSPTRLLRTRVAHLPAREIRKITEEVLARASASGRLNASLTDLPPWLREQGSSMRQYH